MGRLLAVWSLSPVLQEQAVDSFELAQVVAHEAEPFAACMGGDVQAVDADRGAAPLQAGTDLAAVERGVRAIVPAWRLKIASMKRGLRLMTSMQMVVSSR
jgi:hypothetical protein